MRFGSSPNQRLWIAELDAVGPIQPLAGVEGGYFNYADVIGNGQQFLVRTYIRRGDGKSLNQLQIRKCRDGALLSCSDSEVNSLQGMALNPRKEQVVLLAPKAIHIVDPNDQVKTTVMQVE